MAIKLKNLEQFIERIAKKYAPNNQLITQKQLTQEIGRDFGVAPNVKSMIVKALTNYDLIQKTSNPFVFSINWIPESKEVEPVKEHSKKQP